MDHDQNTRILGNRGEGPSGSVREALLIIYRALKEKGYDPVRQIANFLLTGEPTYITAHLGARSIAQKIERDEILEELLRVYLNQLKRPAGPDEGSASD